MNLFLNLSSFSSDIQFTQIVTSNIMIKGGNFGVIDYLIKQSTAPLNLTNMLPSMRNVTLTKRYVQGIYKITNQTSYLTKIVAFYRSVARMILYSFFGKYTG